MQKYIKILTAALSLGAIALCGRYFGWEFIALEQALAQGTTTPTANIFSETGKIAIIIAQAMEMLAFLVFHFLQYFLDPLFIMGFAETAALREIWRYSRDIMNVIFAFMLIGAGIFTVINYNAGKALLQDKFKKFIIAIILVNFSWFFPRVIFDVANVLTATVYQLPAGLPSSGGRVECQRSSGEPCLVIEDVKYFNSCNPVPTDYIKKGIVCYKTRAWDEETNTAYGMLNGLVMNYGRLGELTRVLNPDKGPDAATDGSDRFPRYLFFLMHILFVLVLMAMLFLPLAAMFIAFLIRIPIIWVTIAFMPFMFIGYVADDKLTPGFNSFDIFKHFMKAAFLPVAVAVPFAIGFILLTAVTQIDCSTLFANTPAAELCQVSGPFITGVDTMWGLLMLLTTFIIIWVGFWSAMKIDTIYESATSGIKSFGQSIGKTALKLPLSAPIIPTGSGRGMSILGVDDAVRRINSKLQAGEGPMSALGRAGSDSDGAKSMKDTINDPKSTTNQQLQKVIDELRRDKGAGRQIDINSRIEGVFNDNDSVRGSMPRTTSAEEFRNTVLNSPAFKSQIDELKRTANGADAGGGNGGNGEANP